MLNFQLVVQLVEKNPLRTVRVLDFVYLNLN